MTDQLHALAGQMVALFRQAVALSKAEVDAIIQSGEQDTQRIEHQLDHMLGLCCDPDMLMVFKRLCRQKETAMSEIRPWLGAEISCAKFRTTRDLKIVDCSVHADKNLLGWDAASPEDIQEAVWASIDRGFSRPVDSAAGSTEYIPTQILSELFKSRGLDGVGYKSALHDGYNLALFNVDMAEMVDCQLFHTKRIAYEFSEASTVFRAQKAKSPDEPTEAVTPTRNPQST